MPVALDIDPTPWTDWLVLVVAAFSVIGSVAAAAAWLNRKRKARALQERAELKSFIVEVTKQIQPTYRNEGGSLRDIADKVDVVIDRQAYISDRLDKHIDWHMTKETP